MRNIFIIYNLHVFLDNIYNLHVVKLYKVIGILVVKIRSVDLCEVRTIIIVNQGVSIFFSKCK